MEKSRENLKSIVIKKIALVNLFNGISKTLKINLMLGKKNFATFQNSF